jgi:uncharacterized protein (TIGR04255 family)
MNHDLPSFKNPPLIETAMSVQFKPVEGFTNAHLGLFWNQLRDEYPKVEDAQPIVSQEELFDDKIQRVRLPRFRIVAGEAASRLQMSSRDGRTMVQLQNGRLVFNWRRMENERYPHWNEVHSKFEAAITVLRAFLGDQNLKDIEPKQWEVTYVNHLLKGRDWNEPADWSLLVPGLLGAIPNARTAAIESLGCNYRFLLPDKAGRLHIDLYHGMTSTEVDGIEVLVLQLTARGSLDSAGGRDISAGLAIGHAAIVRKFAEVTGPQAQKNWERER